MNQTPKPVAPAVFFASPRPWSVRIGRNPSWVASVKLLVGRVLFYAPSRVMNDLKETVLLFLTGIVMLPLMLLAVVVAFTISVVAGLLGFLRLPTEQETAEETSDAS